MKTLEQMGQTFLTDTFNPALTRRHLLTQFVIKPTVTRAGSVVEKIEQLPLLPSVSESENEQEGAIPLTRRAFGLYGLIRTGLNKLSS